MTFSRKVSVLCFIYFSLLETFMLLKALNELTEDQTVHKCKCLKVCLLALIRLPKAPYVVPVNQVMSPITDCGGLHIWKTHAAGEMNLHHRNAVGQCFFFPLQTCDPLPQMIAELCSLSVLSCHREYVLTLLFNEKHVAIILFYFNAQSD